MLKTNKKVEDRRMKPVRKAVFPVAGLGTRFLPATKAIPKEMLTVVDRPLIQYAVEEAREAGIEQMIFVTGRGKDALEAHFDISFELETVMTGRGKSLDALSGTRFAPGAIVSVRQQQPLGLGHAVWCAREIVGDEPFAVLLPDDLMVGRPGCLAQMVAAYDRVGGNIVCAQDVPRERTASYGIITPGAQDGRLTEVRGLVEKPRQPRSEWAVTGLYFYDGRASAMARALKPSARGELEITDLNKAYLADGGLRVARLGRGYAWLDTGTHESLLEAGEFVRAIEKRTGQKVASPEEIAWHKGFINAAELRRLAAPLRNSGYGAYLEALLPRPHAA